MILKIINYNYLYYLKFPAYIGIYDRCEASIIYKNLKSLFNLYSIITYNLT